MKYTRLTYGTVDLAVSQFSENGVDELHLFAQPAATGSAAEQLAATVAALAGFLADHGLPRTALVFSRYFVSDHANQTELVGRVRELTDRAGAPYALSVVQQPPLAGAKLALWAYLVHDPRHGPGTVAADSTDGDLLLTRGGYRHHWCTRLLANDLARDSAAQTESVMWAYDWRLAARGLSLPADCLRTWFYVKDVDANYGGLVEARKEHFAHCGLTADTHFIASTGIEGRYGPADANVLLDAYAVGGLAPGQVRYLAARDHLNPTHEYGVTFERGTRVDYGDRRHVFISGTASIDDRGEIAFPGEVRRQTGRALANISALLADGEVGWADVAQMIVYVRDLADAAAVREEVEACHGAVPKVYVLAPVCRPGWLVEIECLAIKAARHPGRADF